LLRFCLRGRVARRAHRRGAQSLDLEDANKVVVALQNSGVYSGAGKGRFKTKSPRPVFVHVAGRRSHRKLDYTRVVATAGRVALSRGRRCRGRVLCKYDAKREHAQAANAHYFSCRRRLDTHPARSKRSGHGNKRLAQPAVTSPPASETRCRSRRRRRRRCCCCCCSSSGSRQRHLLPAPQRRQVHNALGRQHAKSVCGCCPPASLALAFVAACPAPRRRGRWGVHRRVCTGRPHESPVPWRLAAGCLTTTQCWPLAPRRTYRRPLSKSGKGESRGRPFHCSAWRYLRSSRALEIQATEWTQQRSWFCASAPLARQSYDEAETSAQLPTAGAWSGAERRLVTIEIEPDPPDDHLHASTAVGR